MPKPSGKASSIQLAFKCFFANSSTSSLGCQPGTGSNFSSGSGGVAPERADHHGALPGGCGGTTGPPKDVRDGSAGGTRKVEGSSGVKRLFGVCQSIGGTGRESSCDGLGRKDAAMRSARRCSTVRVSRISGGVNLSGGVGGGGGGFGVVVVSSPCIPLLSCCLIGLSWIPVR